MSIRYLYNVALSLAAGFLVVATQAFAPTAVVWLTFGIAVIVTLLSAGALALRRFGVVQRLLAGVTSIIGVWTIVMSLVFGSATVAALGFASALAFAALGLIGLTMHELTTERVVHSLEVAHQSATHERTSEPLAA